VRHNNIIYRELLICLSHEGGFVNAGGFCLYLEVAMYLDHDVRDVKDGANDGVNAA